MPRNKLATAVFVRLIVAHALFTPAFPLMRVAGAAALVGLETSHVFQQPLILVLAPHQTRTNQVGDVIIPPGP